MCRRPWRKGGRGHGGTSSAKNRKKFVNDNALKMRLSCAYRRRFYPNTALHPKVFAAAIDHHRDTVTNWTEQATLPNAYGLQVSADFFASTGDLTFLPEIFGSKVLPYRQLPPAQDIADAFADVLRARGIAA